MEYPFAYGDRVARPAWPSLTAKLDELPDPGFVVGEDGLILHANAAVRCLLGYPEGSLAQRRMLDLVAPADRERTQQEAQQVLCGQLRTGFRNTLLDAQGQPLPVVWMAAWMPQRGVRVGVARPIVAPDEEHLMCALRSAFADAAVVHDDDRDYLSAVRECLSARLPCWPAAPVPAARGAAHQELRWTFRGRNGAPLPLAISAPPGRAFSAADVRVFRRAVVFPELELERRARARALQHWAERDELTGALNRRAILREIETCCAQRLPFTVVFLDLNHFKAINDAHGHRTGDAALRAFHAHVRACCRTAVQVGRLSGDEFALLLPGPPDAAELAQLTQDCRRIPMPGMALQLSAALGWASYPADGTDAHDLLAVADARMYEDKRATCAEPTAAPAPADARQFRAGSED